jgi:hypothetical protein
MMIPNPAPQTKVTTKQASNHNLLRLARKSGVAFMAAVTSYSKADPSGQVGIAS